MTKHYHVVTTLDQVEIISLVNQMLKDGWELYGTVSMAITVAPMGTVTRYAQVLLKDN